MIAPFLAYEHTCTHNHDLFQLHVCFNVAPMIAPDIVVLLLCRVVSVLGDKLQQITNCSPMRSTRIDTINLVPVIHLHCAHSAVVSHKPHMLVARVRLPARAPRIILQCRQVSCCGMIRALPTQKQTGMCRQTQYCARDR